MGDAYITIDRRDFIRTGLGAIAAVITVGSCNRPITEVTVAGVSRWAFFSDTHIPQVNDVGNPPNGHFNYDPHGNLAKIVEEVRAARVEGAAATGDLARLEGKRGDYVELKKMLSPLAQERPVYLALGNHDDRNNFLPVFDALPGEKAPVGGRLVTVIEQRPVRLILLDSLYQVNQAAGLLGKAQRDWLKDYLQNSDYTPTILFVHHTLDDGDGSLLDSPRLFEIVELFPKVKAIVYGHSHVYGFDQQEGIYLINLPATGYSFHEKMPVGWVEAALSAEGGDFTLHVAAGDATQDGKTTKLAWR